MDKVSDGTMAGRIQELKGIMRMQSIDRKRGSADDRILQLFFYGGQLMHGAKIKIGEIGHSIKDFVRQQKERGGFAKRNYIRKRNEIAGVPNGMRLRYKSISL